MNPLDEKLGRLLRAAARVSEVPTTDLPYTIEARVIARWRVPHLLDEFPPVYAWLRRGLVAACLLMMISVTLSLVYTTSTSMDELAIPNAAVNLALMR